MAMSEEERRRKQKEYDLKRREKKKKYYQDNKEHILKIHAEYYQNNKEEIKVKSKEYRKNNIEKVHKREKEYRIRNKDARKIYVERHKEEIDRYQKQYREANKEKTKEYNKKYREGHLEKRREYCRNNKEKITKQVMKKYNSDVNFKIKHIIRHRINMAIKNDQKVGSAIKDLGCSIEKLRLHLEKQFYSNPKTGEMMTWDNYGINGWHIDHINPLSNFDLTNKKQFKKACNYRNLQPLWGFENRSKSNKLNWNNERKK